MTSIKLIVSGASARAEVDGLLTSGMVGIPVTISYDSAWGGLTKALVCRGGSVIRTILNVDGMAAVPHECMIANATLQIGVEGRNADGTLVIPTVWARCGLICSGANADADPSTDPTLPVWAQIESKIGNLDNLNTQAKENLVAAINEAAASGGAGSMGLRVSGGYIQYSTDSGSTWQNLIALAELKGADGSKGDPGAPGKDGHSPVVTATKSGKTTTISVDGEAIATVDDGADGKPGAAGSDGITPHIGDNGNWYLGDTDTGNPSRGEEGPQGPAGADGQPGADGAPGADGSPGKDGADGKSAYQYAQDGGYTGTEAEFATKLAKEKFANPNALTFTGAVRGSYDGSEALTVEIPSGGGSGGGSGAAWTKFLNMTIEEDITTLLINEDDSGHAFSFDEIRVFAHFVGTSANTSESYVEFKSVVEGGNLTVPVNILYAKRVSGSVASTVFTEVGTLPSGDTIVRIQASSGTGIISGSNSNVTGTKKLAGLRFWANGNEYIGAGTQIVAYGMNRS